MNAGATPVSVKVLSIIGIVWAILFLLLGTWNFVVLAGMGPRNPMVEEMKRDSLYFSVTILTSVVAMLLLLLLLFASIGSLSLRRWGRTGMLGFAVAQIVYHVLNLIVSFSYTMPKMMEFMSRTMPAGTLSAFKPLMYVGSVCGVVMYAAFPICILVFFNKPKVKDAFNGIFPDVVSNFPVDYQTPPQQWP